MSIRMFSGLCFLGFCIPVFAGDLESILARYHEARGGIDDLRAVESLRIEGTVEVNATKMPFSVSALSDKVRLEIETGGVRIIKIYDGTNGWQINPMLGTFRPKKLRGDELTYLQDLTDLTGPLVDWRRKGHELTFLGTEQASGRDVHRIKVLTVTGTRKIYGLDAKTNLPLYLDETGEGKVLARFIENTEVDGILFFSKIQVGEPKNDCHRAVHKKNDACGYYRKMEMTLIQVNPDLDPMLFSPGEASLAAAGD
jgi:hypothetical protein